MEPIAATAIFTYLEKTSSCLFLEILHWSCHYYCEVLHIMLSKTREIGMQSLQYAENQSCSVPELGLSYHKKWKFNGFFNQKHFIFKFLVFAFRNRIRITKSDPDPLTHLNWISDPDLNTLLKGVFSLAYDVD